MLPKCRRGLRRQLLLDLTYVLLDSTLTLDNSPVFQSQVIDWIRIQRENGIKVGLVSTVENWERFEEVAGQTLRDCDTPCNTFPHRGLVLNVIEASKLSN